MCGIAQRKATRQCGGLCGQLLTSRISDTLLQSTIRVVAYKRRFCSVWRLSPSSNELPLTSNKRSFGWASAGCPGRSVSHEPVSAPVDWDRRAALDPAAAT